MERRDWEQYQNLNTFKSNTTKSNTTQNSNTTPTPAAPAFSFFIMEGGRQKQKKSKKKKPRSPLVFNPGGEGEGKRSWKESFESLDKWEERASHLSGFFVGGEKIFYPPLAKIFFCVNSKF